MMMNDPVALERLGVSMFIGLFSPLFEIEYYTVNCSLFFSFFPVFHNGTAPGPGTSFPVALGLCAKKRGRKKIGAQTKIVGHFWSFFGAAKR